MSGKSWCHQFVYSEDYYFSVSCGCCEIIFLLLFYIFQSFTHPFIFYSSFDSNKDYKVRSINFFYLFFPPPPELYSEGEARGPISLTLIFFLFVLQLFYISFQIQNLCLQRAISSITFLGDVVDDSIIILSFIKVRPGLVFIS